MGRPPVPAAYNLSYTRALAIRRVAARAAQLPPSTLKKPNSAERERKHVQTRERK